MPVEFEDELGDALRRTADTFQPDDPRELVDSGHLKGRRMRSRRTATVVAGAAAFAAVAVGGVLAGGFAHDNGRGSGVAAAPEQPNPKVRSTDARTVTGMQVAATFARVLPAGTVKDLVGSGPEDFGFPFASASAIFDDGKGLAEVAISLQYHAKPLEPCSQVKAPGVSCSLTHVHGGTLQIIKGYEYPDRRVETKDWTATFVTSDGAQVQLNQWNSSAEKGARITRKDPPLDVAQMTAVVTSKVWRPVLAGIPMSKPHDRSAAEPGAAKPPATHG